MTFGLPRKFAYKGQCQHYCDLSVLILFLYMPHGISRDPSDWLLR